MEDKRVEESKEEDGEERRGLFGCWFGVSSWVERDVRSGSEEGREEGCESEDLKERIIREGDDELGRSFGKWERREKRGNEHPVESTWRRRAYRHFGW